MKDARLPPIPQQPRDHLRLLGRTALAVVGGYSHLQATLLGPSLSVPVADGKPLLGTWQQIIHLECDVRPRRRTVVVTVLGE